MKKIRKTSSTGVDPTLFVWESGAEKSVIYGSLKTTLSLVPPTADPGISGVVWENGGAPMVSDGPVAPVNTVAPSNTGTDAYVGTLRSCNGGTWTGVPVPTKTYQWQRNTGSWVDIASATSATHTLVAGDNGYTVRCKVTATNTGGTTVAYSAATATVQTKTAPSNTAVPTISGTAKVGIQLTANVGTWTGIPAPSHSGWQWQISDDGLSGWANVNGATNATYTPVTANTGKYLRVKETETNSEGSADAYSAATTAVLTDLTAPENTSVPTISGTAKVGVELTAVAGTWTGNPTPDLTYQWQISDTGTGGWSDISGATATTYTPIAEYEGKYARIKETGTNSQGSADAYSAATEAIAPAVVPNQKAVSISFVNPGNGYIGDGTEELHAYDGAYEAVLKFIIDTVDENGAIATYHISDPGSYSGVPSNPVSFGMGTGDSGAAGDVTWENV